MKNKQGFIQIPLLIAIIAGILVVGGAGYIVTKRVNNPEQVIPSEEVLKNNNKESTTTPVADANSIFLKEEMARKRERDMNREKCIADVEQKYVGVRDSKISLYSKSVIMSGMPEDIDRCYFRFPNN